MKKYFLLAAAAATVLAVSCNKEKNQPTTDPTPQIEDNTPQPIRFGTNIAEVKAPITKAAIDMWDGSQKLYIYGFPLANGLSDIANPKIDQVAADSPSTSPTGSRDAIEVLDKTAPNAQAPYPYYYYETGKVYNFFGYYVGDAKTNDTDYAAGAAAPNAGNTAVELPIVIDGSQDIMVATTDKFADYIAAGATVSLDKVYSDVSARNGVVPDLIFKHMLSQFEFKTIYGGADPSKYNTIAIKSLTLDSYSKGTLTVAAADPANIGFAKDANDTRVPLTLKGVPYAADNWASNKFPGDGATPSDYAVLGDEIMAIPEGDAQTPANYTMHLTLVQKDANNNLSEATVDLAIDFEKLENATATYAEAGKKYVVKITIYSLEEINLTVSLEAWEDGGETAIDPDQDPRPVPTIDVTDPADLSTPLALTVGDAAYQIVATAAYGTTPTPIATLKYGTTNKKVATVDADGKITAVAAGTCKVFVYVEATAQYQGVMKTIDVTVSAAAAPTDTELAGVPANQNLDNDGGNASYSITGVTVQAAGVALDPQPTLTYASSDDAIATVDVNGVVHAVADGTVTITISYAGDATYAACQGTFTVTVENTPAVLNP